MTASSPVKPPSPPGLESNALETVRLLELGDEARALLDPKLTVQEYVNALSGAGHYADAVAVLALVLRRREAVWWACLCARSGGSDRRPGPAGTALEAAERWVKDPSDATRRAAGEAAEAEDHETAGALAALGAFFSGGSVAPPEVRDAVPPPEDGTNRAAAAAVTLAAVSGDPEKCEDNFREFVALGVEVARGRQGWGSMRSGSFAAAR